MAKSGKAVRAKASAYEGKTQNKMSRSLEALAEFEVFNEVMLPQLRKMVLEGWSPERIRKAFAPVMQAQMIKKGLAGEYKAVKDTLDRHEGTAVQRVEQKTIHQRMSKQELAALALQKLRDAKLIDKDGNIIMSVDDDKKD